jgi:hypothetical protein
VDKNNEFDILRLQAEEHQIKEELKYLRKEVDKKRTTLYGNGGQGLVSKVTVLEEKAKIAIDYKEEWLKVTNPREFNEMRKDIRFLSKWNWIIVGGLAVISVLLQVFALKIATIL